MERPQLTAKARQRTSTRGARRLRTSGEIPGVVYGKTVEPMTLMVNRRELTKLFTVREGEHGLIDLTIEPDGAKGTRWQKPVLIKNLQRHPVAGDIIHIDFHAIALTEQVRVKVPIVLHGEPVGVKQDGGLLEHFLRDIEVECLPTEIPKQVEFDISAMKIGDTVHASDLPAPAGARIITDAHAVIVSVLAPKAEKVEEPTEAVTEPEVIREKKPEEGEAPAAEGKKTEKKEDKKDEK